MNYRFCIALGLLSVVSKTCAQRAPPGVNPQHYQQQQYQQPPPQYQQVPQQQQQYQQPQQQRQVPQQQQYQQQHPPQQQVPVQHYQQPSGQHQVPVQQHQAQAHHQQPTGHGHGPHGSHQNDLLNTENIADQKEHIGMHMDVPIDTSKMTDQELQFHYFKMHDADNNNKLDGCELIKSLIHWHEQADKGDHAEMHKDGQPEVPREEKIFKDEELVNLIDPILNVDDFNRDGFIDYPEFIRAQQKAAGQQRQEPHH